MPARLPALSPLNSAASLFMAMALSACGKFPAPSETTLRITGSTMGTYYRVTLASRPGTLTEGMLRNDLTTRLEKINSLMSTYKKDSEVSRFNRSSGTKWFPVSEETATVVAEALRIFEQSDGAFDITVGPLVNLWGFGPAESSGQIPSAESISAALEKTGSEKLQVQLSPPAIKKELSDLQIDLSGIAKGYAVDTVALMLDSLGATDYLVDIGGEMRSSGYKAESVPWKIAIESPTAHRRGIQKVLALRDLAIATSGDYRNYFEKEGRRYSHEIDPGTGRPIQHNLLSVSVLGTDCMTADAWATAFIILGPERGRELAEKFRLTALFIVRDREGFREIESSGFKRFIEEQ